MTRAELLAGLGFLETAEVPAVELYILGKPVTDAAGATVIDIYKGRMQENVPGQIRDLFYPKIRKVLVSKDYELQPYDPALSPDRSVVWQYPSAEVPFYNEIIRRLPDAEDRYYDDTVLPYAQIWAVWIKLTIQQTNFYILKKITPSKVLVSGGVLAWVFRGETFTQLDSDILAIDGSFDVLVCNAVLIFENKQNFEKALQFESVMQAAADETLEDIRVIDIVGDFDALKAMLADDQFSIRKLNKLKEKQYFREKTFDDYYRIISDYGIRLDVDMVNRKFTIAGKAQAKLLIKVLNDDYLRSELTDIRYAANSKEGLQN
jgi:hypothetical protein